MSSLPVEVEIKSQKLCKIEADLQIKLKEIQNDCQSSEELNNLITETRIMMSGLKTLFVKFQKITFEWDEDKQYSKNIASLIDKHKTFLRSLQSNFFKACTVGRKIVENIEKSTLINNDKEIVIETNLRKRKQNKIDAAKKATNMTQNLMNIAKMMDDQIKMSEESNTVLEGSSQQVKDSHEEFKGLSGFINISRKLLNKYNRRELTDTLLLFFGLILFFATVLYIISKRV